MTVSYNNTNFGGRKLDEHYSISTKVCQKQSLRATFTNDFQTVRLVLFQADQQTAMLPCISGLPQIPAGQSSRCCIPVTGFAVRKKTGNVRSAESVAAAGQPRWWSYDRRLDPARQSTRFSWVCPYSMSLEKAQQAPTMVLQS